MTQPPEQPGGGEQPPDEVTWTNPPASAGPYQGGPSQPPYPGQPGGDSGETGSYTGPPGPYAPQPGPYPGQPGPYAGQPGQYPGQPGPYAAQPGGQWDELGPAEQQPPARRHRGRLIGIAAVAVAVVAGATISAVALSDKNTTGAATPNKAVQSVVSDLNNADLMAAVDDLPPGERAALAGPLSDAVSNLKRLHVLTSGASVNKVSGLTFQFNGLTYGTPVKVNGHVQLVQVTGGTLQVSGDATKVPFTKQLLDVAFPNGLPATAQSNQKIDLGQQVKNNGHPIQLAAQKVGGRWYPSLFYTVAAAAAHDSGKSLSPSDYVPAVGASSPQEAVTSIIQALLAGDARKAIELTSPQEMAALHDYGGLVLGNSHPKPAPVTLSDLKFATKDVSGGAVQVRLTGATVGVTSNGRRQQITISESGDCYTMSVGGLSQKLCASNLFDQISQELNGLGSSFHLSFNAAQKQAIEHAVTGLLSVGVITTKSGGAWYVNPVRSSTEEINTVLSALQGNDLLELIKLAKSS